MKRIARGVAGALALAAALTAPARAQLVGDPEERLRESRAREMTAESRSVAPVSGPIDAARYVLGPGDVLRMIFSGPLTDQLTLEVGPEGSVLVPSHGVFRVGGMTLEAARAELRRQIGSDMRRDVRVDLVLVRVRLLRVHLAGDVTENGPVELPATARGSDALDGGRRLLPTGSRRNVELRHRDGGVERVDLERFQRTGDTSWNPQLRDDDVVFVPSATEWITVSGAVPHPMRFERAPGDSLQLLLRLGGGLLPSSRRERAQFVRWLSPTARESLAVDAGDIESGRFNPELRDGDRLLVYWVPEFHRFESATILGEVTSPGNYPLHIGTTRLSDLVKAAGGFQPRADLSALQIYRPRVGAVEQDSELDRLARLSRNEMTSSEYEVLRTRLTQRRSDFRIDWNRIGLVPESDIFLQDGDIVRVDPRVASVRVEGQVRRPGLVRHDPGASLSRYVENAGGFSSRAARRHVLVTRAVTGQTIPAREVDGIAPGDLIWVPERSDRTLWQNLATLIMVSAQLATIVIAVRR